MNPAENGPDPGPDRPLDTLRDALVEAREAVQRAEKAAREAESEGREAPAPVTVEGPRWTWREKLWAAPAEARIGVRELREALDVSESWVYARTKQDAEDPIPHRKLGGSLRFVVGEVRAWIRDREEAPVQGPSWSPVESGRGPLEALS